MTLKDQLKDYILTTTSELIMLLLCSYGDLFILLL